MKTFKYTMKAGGRMYGKALAFEKEMKERQQMTLSENKAKNPNYKEKYLKERKKSVDAIEYIRKQKDDVLKNGEENECFKREIEILNMEKEQLKDELKAEKLRTNLVAEITFGLIILGILYFCVGGR